jgi:hypothetical protein
VAKASKVAHFSEAEKLLLANQKLTETFFSKGTSRGTYFALTHLHPALRFDQHIHRVRPSIPEVQPDAAVRHLCNRRRN